MTESAEEFLDLEIGKIATGGSCVARAANGRVVFVRHTLPGERVRAQVTSANATFLRADAVEILEASVDRVAPPCAHAGPQRCGGCDFQHINLAAQRRLKAALVVEQLERLGGISWDVAVQPVPGDVEGLGWRSRIRLGVDRTGRTGFRRYRSHDLEVVAHCPISCDDIEATGVFEARWPGVEELDVVIAPDTHEAIVAVATKKGKKPTLPQVRAGVVVNGRSRRPPKVVNTKVAGVDFRVSPGVFWQVHAGAATVLANAVRKQLSAAPGDYIVDLYAGAGLFSVLLAREVGADGSVLAVERNARACEDARHNGRHLTQLTIKKASITSNLIDRGIGAPDLVVLDPAREGAGKETMAALGRIQSLRRIVYVACDPGTFSRDLRVLLDAGWTLRSLEAFDIFPMTEHIELVASIEPPGH